MFRAYYYPANGLPSSGGWRYFVRLYWQYGPDSVGDGSSVQQALNHAYERGINERLMFARK